RSPSIVLGDAGTEGAGGISSKGNSVDGKSGEENSADEKSAAISAPNSPCSAAWSSSVAADGICGNVLPERSASERCSASNKRLMLSNSSPYYNLWFLLTAIALQEVVKLQQGISGATYLISAVFNGEVVTLGCHYTQSQVRRNFVNHFRFDMRRLVRVGSDQSIFTNCIDQPREAARVAVNRRGRSFCKNRYFRIRTGQLQAALHIRPGFLFGQGLQVASQRNSLF